MNKKNLNILLVILMILLLTGCKSSDYNKASNLIKNNNYAEAIPILEKIPDYKDSKKIIENEKKYENAVSYICKNDFNNALPILEQIKGYRDSNVLLQNTKDMQKLEQEEEKKIDIALTSYNKTGATAEELKNFNRDLYSTIGDYESYISIYKEDAKIFDIYIKLNEYGETYWKSGDTSEDHENYMNSNKDNIIKDISILNPNSTGSGKKEMDVVMQSVHSTLNGMCNITDSEWLAAYNTHGQIENIPFIGMTKDQLLLCKWGKPEKINTTQTINGTSEQWVYPDYKYVYLDSGVVTVIQQ